VKRKGRTITADQVKLLIREGEGLTVEFKERYTPRIDQDIVAFANAKGGTILLGVRDDGAVCGERLTGDMKAKINTLARNCKPTISVEIAQVGLPASLSASRTRQAGRGQTGKVVAIVVPEGTEKPYSCSSGYYRRLDGNTQKMSHDELRIMFAEHDPLPFEEKTVRGFTFDEISKAKIRAFTKAADIRIGRTPVPDFLRSLNVADETRVKNAGILFFAKDVYKYLHHAEITLLAFKGTDRLHIYDRRDVRDDLLTQHREAVAFLKKHLNIRTEIKGFDREDIYEIPLEVLREAVVNALMHRDYSIRGTQIMVEVYDDRVEIVNPGELPKGLSIRKLGKMSVRRNEIIADLFSRLHMVERTGMGIRKMRTAMRAAGLQEPVFTTTEPDGFFRAIFRRSPEFALKKGASEKMSEKTSEKMSEKTPERILTALAKYPQATIADLAEAIGVSNRTIERNLKRLQEQGLLRRVGPAKGGHWEVLA